MDCSTKGTTSWPVQNHPVLPINSVISEQKAVGAFGEGTSRSDELSEELGLNVYDFGARNYDPALGRWMNIDPMAESFFSDTPYNYTLNNPISNIDPDGRFTLSLSGQAAQDFARNLQRELDQEENKKMMQGDDIFIMYKNKEGKNVAFRFDGTNAKDAPKDKFVQDFIEAYEYNINNGGGDNMKKAAFDRDNFYQVFQGNEMVTSFSNSNNGAEQISWAPLTGLAMGDGDIISPATILEHEFDHAVDHANNTATNRQNVKKLDPIWGNAEEKRVVQGSETKTARANGEISPNKKFSRNSYGKNGYFVPVEGPTSNKIRNTKDRPKSIRIGIFNLYKN